MADKTVLPVQDAATRTKLEERAQRVENASDHLEDAVEAFLDDGGDRDDVGRIVERVYLRLSRENDAVARENADRAANLDKKGEPDPQKPRALPHPKLLA